ncbi:S-acyl fatty acid synthase thioesterase, medium chain isoform 2-T2 [Spinachia spinachia]
MEKVISCFKTSPEAVARLICFPWAGGGSIHYARWGNVLNSSIEVFAIKLPGRESRVKEPFFENMQQIVDEVVGVLLAVLKEKPFALFGHRYANRSETRIKTPKRSELTEDEFLKWLVSIGGTPPELLANPEVLKLFLPALKADLHVVENYRCHKPDFPLFSCPVTCFDGKADIPHDLQAWKSITSGDFTVRMFDGSHFYLKESENEKKILDYITQQVETSEMDYL